MKKGLCALIDIYDGPKNLIFGAGKRGKHAKFTALVSIFCPLRPEVIYHLAFLHPQGGKQHTAKPCVGHQNSSSSLISSCSRGKIYNATAGRIPQQWAKKGIKASTSRKFEIGVVKSATAVWRSLLSNIKRESIILCGSIRKLFGAFEYPQ